jgi:hypothetical protein
MVTIARHCDCCILAALRNHVLSSRNEWTHHRIRQATRLVHTRSDVPEPPD